MRPPTAKQAIRLSIPRSTNAHRPSIKTSPQKVVLVSWYLPTPILLTTTATRQQLRLPVQAVDDLTSQIPPGVPRRRTKEPLVAPNMKRILHSDRNRCLTRNELAWSPFVTPCVKRTVRHGGNSARCLA